MVIELMENLKKGCINLPCQQENAPRITNFPQNRPQSYAN